MKTTVHFDWQTSVGGTDSPYLLRAAEMLLPATLTVEGDDIEAAIEQARARLEEDVYRLARDLAEKDGCIGGVSTAGDTFTVVAS